MASLVSLLFLLLAGVNFYNFFFRSGLAVSAAAGVMALVAAIALAVRHR